MTSPSDTHDWEDEIAVEAAVDIELVRDVLADGRIPGVRMLPAPRHLRVEALHFAGVKNTSPSNDDTVRVFTPYSFTHELSPEITAYVSAGKNDAGKSSIINYLLWALRGQTELQGDVRSWTHQVAALFTIDGQRILVAWAVHEGVPSGRILRLATGQTVNWADVDLGALAATTAAASLFRDYEMLDDGDASVTGQRGEAIENLVATLLDAGAVSLGQFGDDRSFTAVVSDVMMTSLGFEAIEAWQRNPKGLDAEDGKVIKHAWPLWSQALVITNPSIKSVLGETPQLATAILQTYLGASWGPATLAARTRKQEIEGLLAGLRRRRSKDEQARVSGVDALREEEARIETELAAFPAASTAEYIDAVLTHALNTADALARSEQSVLNYAREYGRLERELQDAEADELALVEAAVTKRFWHSLKPSCCPRCDGAVDEARWKREQEGSCSICDSPIAEPTPTKQQAAPVGQTVGSEGADSGGDVVTMDDDDDDELDDVEEARARTAVLARLVTKADQNHDKVVLERDLARSLHDEAVAAISANGGDPARRRDLERDLATVRGRLMERAEPTTPGDGFPDQEERVRIVGIAEKVATKRRDLEQQALLDLVSERVTALGRHLGIDQLERATLKGNAHLPVVKGGKKENFGKLTEGERLRLKIAVVIGLLQVGSLAGVGRHPGLLIIDSLAREEVNPSNVETLLRELRDVGAEHGLQVITSSAHGNIVQGVLSGAAIRHARDDGYMW
ncbi:hypothetical protein GU243_08735 [Pseudarthrobacter psychrotolerans]|uniref:Uncharacterized protein n=1 Tax=Pseudarthrobacter psychrotolerans TaxID=2697569 RepID=A0A6P1NL80_9MICC|nr:hypothetical protein [Pseudarthrobacter psychrotolerans]QHK19803.1 hypothetical protein GU243_08735 [Pseudarthrobacter psychrotolerans]